jgi:GDPmannose 4,6-dehydratase
MDTALITGITGQDGTYLAELLIAKGYKVYGLVRGQNNPRLALVERLIPGLEFVEGDLLDQSSLIAALEMCQPTEVYNLGAISFVGLSFKQAVLTGEITGLGVVRMLEAIRSVNPKIRFYQASSSEMFGKVRETPQTERTAFHPRSPYGVAKVYGHYITVNYRESYDMFACSGILFNHECVPSATPVFVRTSDGLVALRPIADVVPHRTDPGTAPRYTTVPAEPLDVWDAHGWTRVTCMTATWNGYTQRPNKEVRRVAARGAVVWATSDHVVMTADGDAVVEKRSEDVVPGDTLALIALPPPTNAVTMSADEAWLLGIIAAEGHITETGAITVTNQDPQLLHEVATRWRWVTGGTTGSYEAPSGFPGGRPVTQLRLTGGEGYGAWIRRQLYGRDGEKRIPRRILNADASTRLEFLSGFNQGDGLRSTPCMYEFQGFKTASAVMAAGLYWLAATTLAQRAIVCLEDRGDATYYQINLNSPRRGGKGKHLVRPLEEVVKSGPSPTPYRGWLFDLATETGTFHAGIGQGWIHNSPRRGLEFVTRKITNGVARIKLGLQQQLALGNLDAERDWGFAGDYVEAMHLMLQQPEPDDFVIATGEKHSVREFLEIAFTHAGLNWRDHVVSDPRFLRPAEVDYLIGDAHKAHEKLGWEPRTSFGELARSMVDYDIEHTRRMIEQPDRL